MFSIQLKKSLIYPTHLGLRCLNLSACSSTSIKHRIPAEKSCIPEMKVLIGDKHIEMGRIKSEMTFHFLLSATSIPSNISGNSIRGSFPAMQDQPQRRDNETQTGLKVQKPFLSQWEHILDTHSSSFVLYVAICTSCRVFRARQVSIGTTGIVGAGGSWSASSEAIWAW